MLRQLNELATIQQLPKMGNIEVNAPITPLPIPPMGKTTSCEQMRRDLISSLKAADSLKDSVLPQNQLLVVAALPGLMTMLMTAELSGCNIDDIKKDFS